ncbi:MAG: argininosuccinate lyase [Deltaproteobacteria bacterium]|nr:argininosuccinate lyase [Deltaproteobacteria bacterium]MBP7285452.1 argininosuccinate lyase [Nannocystaceae bacterium]
MARIARTAATGDDLDPAMLAWSSSYGVDRRLLEVDCRGSIGHVEGLAKAGLVDADEAARLVAALASLPARVASGEVVLPDDEEDVHMAVEQQLGRELGALAGKLHTGRSRNDQVATDLMLWCRGALASIERGLDAVLTAAAGFVATQGEVAMPAYTHRQVAIPVLSRLWIEGALIEPLRRDRRLLLLCADELVACPLGAGAIAGTSLPLPVDATASALGFAHGPRNPIDAVGHRDHALSIAFACTRIGLHLARFAADVIELCSDGLVALGGAIAGGSSMMPHKRNPDLFELVRGHAALRHGELTGLLALFGGLGSGYHRDLQHDKTLLFSAVEGVCGCLDMTALGLRHITLVPAKCRAALVEGDAIATDLCEALVLEGVPFRDAYRSIGALVSELRAAGRRLASLDAAELAARGLPASLAERLDPEAVARRRSVPRP